MCLPSRSPSPPQESKESKMERESQVEKEQTKTSEMKQDALEENVSRKRRGTGRRSLLTGSGGGIGYYDRYSA